MVARARPRWSRKAKSLMSRPQFGKPRTILPFVLVLSFLVWFLNSVSNGWFGLQHGRFGWIFLGLFVAGIMLYPLPLMRMKRKAIAAVTQGDYDQALEISRRWLRSETYGNKFQGWIMLAAGRYSEAVELLKDGAFDETGRPLLNSEYFYYYAVALMSEEKYSKARHLLEEAVASCHDDGYYLRLSLAECLLSQNKEPERALGLIMEVRTSLNKKSHTKSKRLISAQCSAIGAWALAACGRREDAKKTLQDAFAESDSFSKDDLAGLLNSKGWACQALGDNERSRAAFQEALATFPHGSIAVLARRELARLGEQVHK
jgi:tetratricopeptide (TPR) repeat protein